MSTRSKRAGGWRRRGGRLFALVASLLVLFSLLGAPGAAAGRLQPQLARMAARDPQQVVDVIVQKSVSGQLAEQTIEALGGHVTKDLHLINASAAQMTAAAAVRLSQSGAVRWVSLDAVVQPAACAQCIDNSKLANAYITTIRADKAWNASPYIQGQGIGVAVIDSGINPNGDLYTGMGVSRQVADVRFNTDHNQNTSDGYGHGTVVSSILAGDGSDSGGKYIGVAPMVNVVNVKVSNDDGSATASSVVQGLQWVYENKARYNIRVVNLSFNSSVAESYQTSPLDAAVEILWFNGVVVVVSAGNNGSAALYPPANDPFVITVGATDDRGTPALGDDLVASFSASGTTGDGFAKPDLVAPGKNIVGRLVNTNMGMAQSHPANVVSTGYFRMSGTSASAPIVSGAVALLLQDEPNLTPDQVKYRLMATANKNWAGYRADAAGAGCVDVYAAVKGTSSQSANTGLHASNLLTTGTDPITWNSVGWNSVGWNTVGWNTVGWNTVGWNTVGWNSDYWGQ
ncbi:MAG TPA: S8 family peptidase [Anaerolineales bacterium]|nr:S8 family peptidase [Anaerolineales bacterium]